MRGLAAGVLAAALLAAGIAHAKPEHKREPTFKKPGHIHGYLVNPAGEGLMGLVVLCTPDGARLSEHHTDGLRKGRFDIDNLFPGRYRLRVQSVGAVVTDLVPPEDMEVEVRAGKVSRPRLVAATEK